MELRILPLIAIGGLAIIFCLPHVAYSDFISNESYLIQGTGFVANSQNIFDSTFNIQITAGSQSGSSILSTLQNSQVIINGDNYLNTGNWNATLLRGGKFLLLQGNAQDQHGNTIQLNLFGRQMQISQNGFVYSISGKITNSSETLKVIYSAEATMTAAPSPVSTPAPAPTPVPTPQPTQSTIPPNAVQINILPSSSKPSIGPYFSPATISVSAGTTIVWTNNDNVPHRIESGVASAVALNGSMPAFTADGMIDSGMIAPGKSFQYTITNFNSKALLSTAEAQYMNLHQQQTLGDITFFDPNYTWMIGVISPASSATNQTQTVQVNILAGASNATSNLYLSPSSIRVASGTTIVWKNNDSVPHEILSGQLQVTTVGGKGISTPRTPAFVPDGMINSGNIYPGQTFQYTITGTGFFSYYDPTNTWLNGNILVVSNLTQQAPVQISILAGSSLPQGSASQQNQNYVNGYYSPDQVEIAPGTTIIWTNNDSIAHSIWSGTATLNPTNPYIPDGKIKSGPIAPGKTFQVTINDTGMTRFYDPSYTWMNGIVISLPDVQNHILNNNIPSNVNPAQP